MTTFKSFRTIFKWNRSIWVEPHMILFQYSVLSYFPCEIEGNVTICEHLLKAISRLLSFDLIFGYHLFGPITSFVNCRFDFVKVYGNMLRIYCIGRCLLSWLNWSEPEHQKHHARHSEKKKFRLYIIASLILSKNNRPWISSIVIIHWKSVAWNVNKLWSPQSGLHARQVAV